MNAMPRIRDFEDTTFNPFTAMKVVGGEQNVKDFYPELKRLRDLNPVFDGDLRAHFGLPVAPSKAHMRHVAILGYNEARDVLRTPTLYSNKVYENNLGVYFGRSVTVMDPPEHTHNRQLFQLAFAPGRIQAYGEEIIPRLINNLIDKFEARGRAELVSEFTLHFPFHFIHELMALPMEDRAIFHKLAFGQITIDVDRKNGMDAVNKLKAYLTEVVMDRRRNPRPNDFISTIATAEVEGERLSDEVVISFFRQLMNAGGDTSYNGFSSVLAGLLQHPDQFDALKKDRTLVPKAIEEGLRWNCPVPSISRTPVEQVELSGVTIKPGDEITVCLAAANRDDKMFANPDAFDIHRASRGHAAFGLGPHICIGQFLARLEMINAMNALLDRLPRLRADPDQPAPVISGYSLRGPQQLHVRFD